MKNFASNQRPPGKGNGQRPSNRRASKSGQDKNKSGNNQNRNSGSGRKSHAPHLWTSSSSSTTLTSHLSMIDRRNQNGTNKNKITKNGTGRSSGKSGSDIERILAFNSMNKKDPIQYKESWEEVLRHALKVEKEFKG